ncbi:cell wall protein [Agromyces mediolanus]|nr:cell wall protein [Agromyces mediolanus]
MPPTLAGSTAAALCVANVPWIDFDVVLTDPDQQSTGHTAYLVLSDGTNTEKVELGPLGEDGSVDGRVLWPGAAIDEAGNPTAWPGWKQLPNGRWVVTEENFGWTHSLTSAYIEVNPELSIDLEYPPAVVGCGPASKPAGTPGTPVAAGDGQGLASTGFAGGPAIAIAGGLVLAGALALAVQLMLRRKRA